MARIRSSKPEWWRKPKWCALPRDVRFTYKGIWEVMCDDFGRFLADARLIKGDVWPFDDDVSVKKVEAWLAHLATIPVTTIEGGRSSAVVLYEVDGVRYGYLPGFVKHQKISHKTPSKFPPPPEQRRNHVGEFPETDKKNSPTSGSGAGAEWDGDMEGDLDSGAGAPNASAPPAPLSGTPNENGYPLLERLPKAAVDFLGMFYEPALTAAARERYRDVAAQLCDTVDEKHPGPKIRGGTRVKARSIEHLADCCASVMRDPPRDRDKAVVIVLKMLLDPPKGPSVTEKAKADEQARIAEEEAYQRAARSAGIAWAKAHPDEYTPIVAALEAEFPNADANAFMRMARDSALTQRCAKAAGFPDFDAWRAERLAS